ncbi:MAG: TusE/DsrC/DsvC family sulfur relay protein [Xanthomonadales bacterium]|nr:TusE/DsrC/DsvC family sulfur relay protein [Xanthomonadales bacterium]
MSELVNRRVAGRELAFDQAGYLADWDQWDRDVARALAAEDELELSPAHWEIIEFLRDYYEEFAMAPPIRLLLKAVAARLGQDKGQSRYLYRLFPEGPAKQACRYAGLPKPVSCI